MKNKRKEKNNKARTSLLLCNGWTVIIFDLGIDFGKEGRLETNLK